MGAGSGEVNDYRPEPEMRDAVDEARREALEQAQEDQNPEAIRREIEVTRADLTETVDAIQQKLNPQRIREEAVSTVREATVGRVEDMADEAKWKVKGAGNTVLDTIKRNPVPAALMALGLGWLIMEGRNTAQSNRYDEGRYEGRYEGRGYQGGRYYEGRRYEGRGFQNRPYYGERYAEARSGSYPAQAGYGTYGSYESYEGTEQGRGRLQEATQDARQAVSGAAQDVRETVSGAAQSARETVSGVADEAQWRAQQLAEEAEWRARQVKSRFSEMMDENPLLIAAGAAALGAVVGFALPSTEKESELFGDARDSLMEKAQETASETMHKVQRVAEEATDAAKEAVRSEAENQGLKGQK